MENSIYTENSWEQLKEKIKEVYPEITDSDLLLNAGKEEEVFDTLSKKLNKSKEKVKAWLESLASNSNIAG